MEIVKNCNDYEVGVSVGLQKASDYLMAKAVQKFEQGDDFSAQQIRDFSTFFQSQSKLEHPESPIDNGASNDNVK